MSDQGGWERGDEPWRDSPAAAPPARPSAPSSWQPPPPPPLPPPPPGSGGWQPPPPPPPPPGGNWQPQSAPAYGYSGGPVAQRTESLATWSLILGILAFIPGFSLLTAIPAIITGAKARKRIDSSGGAKSGRGAATAGLVLGIVNTVLTVIAIILIVALAGAASKHTPYTDLVQGDCFNRVSSSSIFSGSVDKVGCSIAHDAETVGSFEASGGSYPGAAGIRTQAQPQCSTLAQQYVTGDKTGLQTLWYYPQKNTWDNGTHTVMCAVQKADGTKLTTSLH